MSCGWNPTVHLYCQAGGSVRYEPRLACLAPEDCAQRLRIVGAANGEFDLQDALASAVKAGREAGRASLVNDRIATQRHVPMHAWHIDNGALMEDYGSWKRPACYLQTGERREQAIAREVSQVRERLGLFDGSPLGKVEVRGPDSGTFLDRIYMNSAASLAVGRARYAVMLNENGIVLDDGVFARLAPDHFLLSTPPPIYGSRF